MNVAIFGNANASPNSYEWDVALKLGEELSNRGYNVVTGGYFGVMEAAYINAKDNIEKIGVILKDTQPNQYVNKVIVVDDYISRLLKLVEIADIYIVLPGGTGTLLEFSMVWALKERNLLGDKKIIVMGEEWYELIDMMAFYNEKVLDNLNIINKAENVEDVIKIIENN